jgi:DNA-directed RNA polymerase subunit E'/Rpb7
LKRAAVEDADDVEASTDIDARHRDARDGATRADVMATADATAAAPRAVGEIVRGVVRAVRAFGVFVRVDGDDSGKDALMHRDDCGNDATFSRDDDDEAIKHALEYFYPVGHRVWGKVTSVREDERKPGTWRVALDASVVDQATGEDLDPTGAKTREKRGTRDGDRRAGGAGADGGAPRFGGGGGGGGGPAFHPELHKVYRGKARTVKPVGVFVDIRGFRRGGLVHRTQISQYLDVPRDVDDEEKIRVISGVVAEGDDVWVKVVDVETTDGAPPRVSLSMKNVDQGNGEDLDPNNLNYEPPFRGGGGGGGGGGYRPVGADAGQTVQAGAIRWGHHAGDVKQYGSGGKQYELLLEGEGDVIGGNEDAPPSGLRFGTGDFVSRLRAAGGSPTRVRDGSDRDLKKPKKERKEKKEKKEKKSKKHKKSSRKRSRRDYSSDDSSSSDSYSRSRSPRRR